MSNLQEFKIAIIGLGYVGLPLALAFGKRHETIGFDINARRIAELKSGRDRTLEVDKADLAAASRLTYASDIERLSGCDVFIVAVPTPIDEQKRPDLSALTKACETIGRAIGKGGIAVFESTVYPGCTEEVCVPIIERVSGLRFNEDFFVGYSPERANPGDRVHRLETITKVVAGSTPETTSVVEALYGSIVSAGVYRAASIATAEAAKVIENTQRDLNIALVNEFAVIFNQLGLDTLEVLETAATKWNFLPFKPGLVGGHCIGVDPYYLTAKAQSVGYHPEVILSGRRINDGMGAYVVACLVKEMVRRRVHVNGARVLVLGLTFKENCPDLRNTRVVDVVEHLKSYGADVDIHDPWVDAQEARDEYGLEVIDEPASGAYDGIVVAVAHDAFRELGAKGIKALCKPTSIVFDVKGLLPRDEVDLRL